MEAALSRAVPNTDGCVMMEFAMDTSFLNRYFLFESGRKSHDNLHLNLPFRGQWVHEKGAGVHRYIETFRSNFALLADGNGGDDGADRDLVAGYSAAVADGNSPGSSCWQLPAPFGFLCGCTQHLEPGFRLRKIRIVLE